MHVCTPLLQQLPLQAFLASLRSEREVSSEGEGDRDSDAEEEKQERSSLPAHGRGP